jgi:hypothetical protein
MREWFRGLLAGDFEWAPENFLRKLRQLEALLPWMMRGIGIRGVSSFLDLLPTTDEDAGRMLELLHVWSGQMLAGEPAGPVPGGTPGTKSIEAAES